MDEQALGSGTQLAMGVAPLTQRTSMDGAVNTQNGNPVNISAKPASIRKGIKPTLREEGGDALILAGLTHDARNLVTALGLCAELLSEPGVLKPKHSHFGAEILSIAQSSAQLVQRLSELTRTTAAAKEPPTAEERVTNLAESVRKVQSLLGAIAGPVIDLQLACLPCEGMLQLTEESLSRILVNLVRNAADAMPTGGRIRITAQRGGGASFLWMLEGQASEESSEYLWDDAPHGSNRGTSTVLLTVEDSGPGISEENLARVFEKGFTTRDGERSWPETRHHGLGLHIVRQLVEAAGGTVRAVNAPLKGARFEVELPLTNVTPNLPSILREDSASDAQ
jgi:signal transduction histidine kinase